MLYKNYFIVKTDSDSNVYVGGGGRREGEETGKIMCVKVNFAWVCEKRGNVCVCVCVTENCP